MLTTMLYIQLKIKRGKLVLISLNFRYFLCYFLPIYRDETANLIFSHKQSLPQPVFYSPKNNKSKNNDVSNNSNNSINSTTSIPNSRGVLTPVWMKPAGTIFDQEPKLNFNFNFEEAMNFFDTSHTLLEKNRKSLINKDKENEIPLDVLFSQAIKIANENIQKPGFLDNCFQTPIRKYSIEGKIKKNYRNLIKDYDDSIEMNIDKCDNIDEFYQVKTILKNVVVYVSRKLLHSQTKLYHKVDCLGGDFIWQSKDIHQATHFIYDGHLNDQDSELEIASKMNKMIVNSKWLDACLTQNKKVDEYRYFIKLANA
jgi:hypothetical protein